MTSLLDALGSTIIGGVMCLLLFQVNAQISMNSREILQGTFTSKNAIDASNMLEYDLSKLGFGIFEDFITAAEQHKIEFQTDYFNKDSIVNVLYIVGDSTELSGTPNPNDRPLYRKFADEEPLLVSVLRDFNITYLDSAYDTMDYLPLLIQENRDKIRGIQLYFKIEASEPVDGSYPFVEFRRIIIPKNLGRKIK